MGHGDVLPLMSKDERQSGLIRQKRRKNATNVCSWNVFYRTAEVKPFAATIRWTILQILQTTRETNQQSPRNWQADAGKLCEQIICLQDPDTEKRADC